MAEAGAVKKTRTLEDEILAQRDALVRRARRIDREDLANAGSNFFKHIDRMEGASAADIRRFVSGPVKLILNGKTPLEMWEALPIRDDLREKYKDDIEKCLKVVDWFLSIPDSGTRQGVKVKSPLPSKEEVIRGVQQLQKEKREEKVNERRQ